MDANSLTGLLLILLAGTCSGVFSVPFKFNRGWVWENNWFVWSFAALLVMPWTVAWLTVPGLGALYGGNPGGTVLVALFGLLWGVGAILFGKGIDALGISLSLPIMQGLINTVGTLTPVLLRDPAELLAPSGLRMLCWRASPCCWPESSSLPSPEAARLSFRCRHNGSRPEGGASVRGCSSACWPVSSGR